MGWSSHTWSAFEVELVGALRNFRGLPSRETNSFASEAFPLDNQAMVHGRLFSLAPKVSHAF